MKERSIVKELILWTVLLVVDAVVVLLVHNSYKDSYFVLDTMVPFLMIGAFVPLFAGAMRYLPKRKGLWVLWTVLCVGAAIGAGLFASKAFYKEAYARRNAEQAYEAARLKAEQDAAPAGEALTDLFKKITEGEIPESSVTPSGKVLFAQLDNEGVCRFTSLPDAVLGEDHGHIFPNANLAKSLEEADTVVFQYRRKQQNGTWINRDTGTQRAAMWDYYYMVMVDMKNGVRSGETYLFDTKDGKPARYAWKAVAELMGVPVK